jgi:hypothetical protein
LNQRAAAALSAGAAPIFLALKQTMNYSFQDASLCLRRSAPSLDVSDIPVAAQR